MGQDTTKDTFQHRQQKRKELRDSLFFKETIQELFRIVDRPIQIGSTPFSPEMMWRKHHMDITFNHLRGFRNQFQNNWDIFTPDEQAILQDFTDRSFEYEKEWKVNHNYSLRCPLFLDMDKVLMDVGGL